MPTSSEIAWICLELDPVQITKKSANEVIPVRSKTLMSVACLASAARTAISQGGVSIWVLAGGFSSLLVRQYSYLYRSRWHKAVPCASERSSTYRLGYAVFQPFASHHRIRFSGSAGASSSALKFIAMDCFAAHNCRPAKAVTGGFISSSATFGTDRKSTRLNSSHRC